MTVLDLVIVGGGCAGLSLASRLAELPAPARIVVIEPRRAYTDDRSWCFWLGAETEPGLEANTHALIKHRWPRWLFGVAGNRLEARQCGSMSYQYLRSVDFYQSCQHAIESSDSVELHLGQTVKSIVPMDAGWEISTGDYCLRARQVLDTRGPSNQQLAAATIQQVFLGVEIELQVPADIDALSVELMTDMRVVEGEFCFTYVLPLSATRLLVEVTFFAKNIPSRSMLEQELTRVLQSRGWQEEARVIRQEYAALPMGLPLPRDEPGQPARAGIGGGALRASSGYGFLRIQRWAEQCAAHYHRTGEVIGQQPDRWWCRWMDQLFLDVIAADATIAPVLFERLLGLTVPARFVRFMNDEATPVDRLWIIAVLPKWPFIKTLIKREVARLAGRP